MARFIFKKGEAHYTKDQMDAIMILVRRVANILVRLSEHDARIVAFAMDPGLDAYVLGGWDKHNIIQEALETLIARNFSPSELNNKSNYVEDNLFDIAEDIDSGIYKI